MKREMGGLRMDGLEELYVCVFWAVHWAFEKWDCRINNEGRVGVLDRPNLIRRRGKPTNWAGVIEGWSDFGLEGFYNYWSIYFWGSNYIYRLSILSSEIFLNADNLEHAGEEN